MMLGPRFLALASFVACAFAAISQQELEEHRAHGLRLVSIQEGVDPIWVTEAEKLKLMAEDVKFFDMTEVYDPEEAANPNARIAAAPRPEVVTLLSKVSQSQSQSYMSQLTSYNNRYYKATTGVTASTWIETTLANLASANSATGARVTTVTHSGFSQKSVVASFPGSNPSAARVIFGAHFDSINQSNPTSGRAPGADDDGSGIVNLMEAFRVLVQNGFKPSSPVEFHFYAGEEAGLLGSQAIARSYKSSGVQVKAMVNLDMTAFMLKYSPASARVQRKSSLSFLTYVNSALTTTLTTVVDNYLRIGWVRGNAGIPHCLSLRSSDANANGVIHSTSDTSSLSGFSWPHLLEFTKFAIAASYELSL
ncbi:aminopeptidase [Coprinopsis sp. MPI-PUGE-AT-0042]|nr:aminopeptidase [Coprinopsis sp. MPI-PUGE-AT-0042]